VTILRAQSTTSPRRPRRRPRACPATVEHDLVAALAAHEDRIERTVDIGQRVGLAQQRRVDARLDAVTLTPPRNGQQLDDIAHALG